MTSARITERYLLRLFHLSLLFAFAGCTQLPSHVTISDTKSELDHVDIGRCGVRISFSGSPRKLRDDEFSVFANQLPKYSKWEIDGWVFEKFRLAETAVCLCRDYPLTTNELQANMELFFKNTSGPIQRIFSTPRSFVQEGVGPAFESESAEPSAESKMRMRVINPRNAASCIVIQTTQSPSVEAASLEFFSRLTLTSSATKPREDPSGTASPAERLRQLDLLLKDRLITPEEYNEKRRVILERL